MVSSGGMFDMWAWVTSLGVLAMLQQFIPREYTDGLRRFIQTFLRGITTYVYCEVQEYDNGVSNKLYQDVMHYLSSHTLEGAHRVNMCKAKAQRAATFSMANDEGIFDTFKGARVYWVHTVDYRSGSPYSYSFMQDEKRKFTLRLKRKDKERILDSYMEHIESQAKVREREARDLLLYTNSKSNQNPWASKKRWESVTFSHPANFNTLALDGDMKIKILNDLEKFATNENFYKKVGKAWKRGYLLYGPPGTGKSSMIAAIANKMRYDVYDLELTEVESNSQLRKLLLQTSSKSIIVIEDIDCSLDLSGQRKKKKEAETTPVPGAPPKPKENPVTLSGLLNFVDGLWSCCGSERIFVFTTNYIEKLDPALLRAGRMDMHIHLNYCTFSAFLTLSQNYLELTDHELFEDVERAFQGSYMTPAEVSEVLIKNLEESPEVVLQKLIEALGEHREDPRVKRLAEEKKEEEEEEAAALEAKKEEAKTLRLQEGDKKEKEEKDAKSNEEGRQNATESDEQTKSKEGDEGANLISKVDAMEIIEETESEMTESEKAESEETESTEGDEVVKASSKVDAIQQSSNEGDTKESGNVIRTSGEKIVPVDDTDLTPDQKSFTTKSAEEIISSVPPLQI